jgi:hypothetical protein
MAGRKIMRKIIYNVIISVTVNAGMRNEVSKEETSSDWGHLN